MSERIISIQAQIDQHQWFHGLDFGHGLVAKGRSIPENWSLYGVLTFLEGVTLRGAHVLDVGTMDGLVAFIAESEGASRVVATDLYDRQPFRLAKEILNSQVEYLPRTSIEDLIGQFGRFSFDVVIMGGLLYHLVSPLRAILIGRALLKTGGVLVLETVATEDPEPTLRFNLSSPIVKEYTTYFVPSIVAVREMMRFSNFHILGANKVRPTPGSRYVRGTVFGQASAPECARASSELMREAQARASLSNADHILDEFNFNRLRGAPESTIQIGIQQSEHEVEIQKNNFRTKFSLQP